MMMHLVRVVRSALRRRSGHAMLALLMVAWPHLSSAIPLFNRQTGQNCMACHAGGQFPSSRPTAACSR
jgi:hypothetical protein